MLGAVSLLAVVGGFLDAYTYIARGGVFANAQTGNMVLIGIYAIRGQFAQAFDCLYPVMAFFAGVVTTEHFRRHYTPRQFLEWTHVIIAIEIALLFGVGLLPPQIADNTANILVSFICSMQVNSFRSLGGLPYSTTMCTGNLRSAAEKFYICLSEKDEEAGAHMFAYFYIIGAFCIGAALGAVLTTIWQYRSVWSCCVILAFALARMLKRT